MPELTEDVHAQAKIIWDYHQLFHSLEKSDGIFVLGSNDVRVAEYAATLYLEGWAPLLIFSGGLGNFTKGVWDEPEAEKFANIAVSMGVPKDKILTEPNASNTGENIRFTKKLLKEKEIPTSQLVLVQKPFMERRTYATVKVEWPSLDVLVTSPRIPYEEYPNETITTESLIHAMVGDLQRIMLYPEKGFQIAQDVPEEVMKAYEYLISVGFTQHLMQ